MLGSRVRTCLLCEGKCTRKPGKLQLVTVGVGSSFGRATSREMIRIYCPGSVAASDRHTWNSRSYAEQPQRASFMLTVRHKHTESLALNYIFAP